MNEYSECLSGTFHAERSAAIKTINDWILYGKRKGYRHFRMTFSDTLTFSNVLAPIAGILDHYRELGMRIECCFNPNSYISHTRVENAMIVHDYFGCYELTNPLDKVWQFSSTDEIYELVSAVILYVRKTDAIQPGVAQSIEWCLNEAMDNILQHSESTRGYFMGQMLNTSKIFSFCIFDSGRGIFNSLRNSIHHPNNPFDAITLAMQERVTRDSKVGQGNGLWGLSEIIRNSNGYMSISSQGATYTYAHGTIREIHNGDFNLGRNNGTTLINCQLNYDKDIDITKALHGYTPQDLWLENLEENDDEYLYSIATMSSGTGTRKAAEFMRNIILNTMKEGKKKAILDFAGVNVVSSSYADELIGKILAEVGFMNFLKLFRIDNASKFVSSIVDRSVQQRMAQQYYNEIIDETAD